MPLIPDWIHLLTEVVERSMVISALIDIPVPIVVPTALLILATIVVALPTIVLLVVALPAVVPLAVLLVRPATGLTRISGGAAHTQAGQSSHAQSCGQNACGNRPFEIHPKLHSPHPDRVRSRRGDSKHREPNLATAVLKMCVRYDTVG
jgi:hypothetical protein